MPKTTKAGPGQSKEPEILFRPNMSGRNQALGPSATTAQEHHQEAGWETEQVGLKPAPCYGLQIMLLSVLSHSVTLFEL